MPACVGKTLYPGGPVTRYDIVDDHQITNPLFRAQYSPGRIAGSPGYGVGTGYGLSGDVPLSYAAPTAQTAYPASPPWLRPVIRAARKKLDSASYNLVRGNEIMGDGTSASAVRSSSGKWAAAAGDLAQAVAILAPRQNQMSISQRAVLGLDPGDGSFAGPTLQGEANGLLRYAAATRTNSTVLSAYGFITTMGGRPRTLNWLRGDVYQPGLIAIYRTLGG